MFVLPDTSQQYRREVCKWRTNPLNSYSGTDPEFANFWLQINGLDRTTNLGVGSSNLSGRAT
jgi:hypothetical protein